mmetsp:Transcript_54302/g.118413  ORF Transcript_54302/g.118413 Transcript_54302/m.118413 type:complete len:287 (+) Transcript_54302:816-1676(+)
MNIVVCRSAMLGDIHPGVLNFGRHAQDAGKLHRDEHDNGEEGDPSNLDDESGDRSAKHLAAAKEKASVFVAGVVGPSVVGARVDWVTKEANCQDAPEAAGAVHRKGVQRVVDAKHIRHETGCSEVDEASDDANDVRVPGSDCGATSSNGDEASEDAVADHGNVPGLGGEQLIQQNGRHAASAGRKGRRQDYTSHSLGVAAGGQRKSRARVETVPAKPEDESTEHAQHRRVTRHWDGLLGLIITPLPRADDCGAPKGRHASSHVDHARASKVDAAAENDIIFNLGER